MVIKNLWMFLLVASSLYAAADFCTEDSPCEEEIPCPYCPSAYYGAGNEDEDFREVISWPGRQDEPFMDALRR